MEIDRVVRKLKATGAQVNDADISLISPLLRLHLIITGTYFNKSEEKQPAITIIEE